MTYLISKRYVPLVLLILNCIIFFVLLPGAVAEEHSSLFAILGGAITVVLCFWTFAKTTPNLSGTFPLLTNITAILSFFLFAILFIYRAASFKERDLEKNGIVTMARIVEKTWIPGKRGRALTSIRVVFQTRSKGLAGASIDISKRKYSELAEGMKIPVLYSEAHPGMAALADEKTLEY